MTKSINLGEFEQVVLLAILRLGETAYGAAIGQEIADCTGRRVSVGALYTALDRLEAKRLVKARLGDPTPQRGGRSKRYFTITALGRASVTRAQQAYANLLRGLELIGENDG